VKIAFDSRAASDPRGIGRYVRCLLTALRDTEHEQDEIVETHRPRRADLYHAPWVPGAIVHPHSPQVVTLHDLSPLKRRATYLRNGRSHHLRYMAAARAERVIVPTEVVADDAESVLRIPRERIVVVPEAPATAMTPRSSDEVAAVREAHDLPEEYLLWVGGLDHPDPRKRVTELANTARELPLVLVGAAKRWAHELPNVTLTGQVTDDELAALYSGARALVLCSDDEGFGLPPVEALACGTPVVACDVPAVREVLGDKATFVEADDFQGLLSTAAVASRPAPAPPAWTWEDAAYATWAVYREAVTVERPAAARASLRTPRVA
jgi:glycosyltransferase involved in cell wall biosynthesis